MFTGFIRTTIGMLGVNTGSVNGVVHETVIDGTTVGYIIDTLCATGDGPALSTDDECFWVSSGPGNTAIVTVWTHTNGKLKAF